MTTEVICTIGGLLVVAAVATTRLCVKNKRKKTETRVREQLSDLDQIFHPEFNDVLTTEKKETPDDTIIPTNDTDNEELHNTIIEPDLIPNLPEEKTAPEEICSKYAELKLVTESIQVENLKGLVIDRIEEIEEASHPDDAALLSLSFIQELKLMAQAYSDNNAKALTDIITELERLLTIDGYTILDSDEWDSSTQRAVKIHYDLVEGDSPTIKQKVSLGLSKQGRIIKKQEVELLKPQPTQHN